MTLENDTLLYMFSLLNKFLNSIKVAAASADPPPSPAPTGIFLSDDADMTKVINLAFDLASETAACEEWENVRGFEQQIRKLIAPFNQIGLCDPDQCSMYSHTAVL